MDACSAACATACASASARSDSSRFSDSSASPGLELPDGAIAHGARVVDGCELLLKLDDTRGVLGDLSLGSGQRCRCVVGSSQSVEARLLERRQETAQLRDDDLALREQIRTLAGFLAEPGQLVAQGCDLGTDRGRCRSASASFAVGLAASSSTGGSASESLAGASSGRAAPNGLFPSTVSMVPTIDCHGSGLKGLAHVTAAHRGSSSTCSLSPARGIHRADLL